MPAPVKHITRAKAVTAPNIISTVKASFNFFDVPTVARGLTWLICSMMQLTSKLTALLFVVVVFILAFF
jgi:hypothetical protein